MKTFPSESNLDRAVWLIPTEIPGPPGTERVTGVWRSAQEVEVDAGAQDTASQVDLTPRFSVMGVCQGYRAEGDPQDSHPSLEQPITSVHKVPRLRPSLPLWWCGWGKRCQPVGTRINPSRTPSALRLFEHGQSKKGKLATVPSSLGHTSLTCSFFLTPEPCSPALNALLPQFCTSKHHPCPGTLPSAWLGTYSMPGTLHSSSLQPGDTVQRPAPPILP